MEPIYCSWSGGKDSALALHRAARAGAEPRLLLTMMTESGDRSRSHGLRGSVLQAQAEAMGLLIRFGAASWQGYEQEFSRLVGTAVADGVTTGVYGDIDIADHRTWVETVSARVGARAWLPLWQSPREVLVRELLSEGFTAMVVAVRDGALPPDLLGEVIDERMLERFEDAGVDLAGEQGEYHTIVVDGPVFERPLAVEPGEVVQRDGVWFLDLAPCPPRLR